VKYISINDDEALKAGFMLTKNEGILPALESAHAVAVLEKIKFKNNEIIVVNISGRGDKDLVNYLID
jgi:tryptophan synthase beta chain